MVLSLLAVGGGPLEFTLALELHAFTFGVEQVLGVQAGLDALGQVNFLFGVQQAHTADLLQVVLDRVGGCAGRDHTTLRIARRDDVLFLIIRVGDHVGTLFLGLLGCLGLGFFLVLVVFHIVVVGIVLIEVCVVGIAFVNVVKILAEVVNIQIVVVDLGIVIKLVIDLSVLVFDELIVLGLLRGFLRGGLARGLFRGLCGLGLLGRSLARGGRRAGLLLGLGLLAGLGCLLGCRRFLRGQNCSF